HLLQCYSGTVDKQLCRTHGHRTGRETDVEDGVGSHGLRLGHHTRGSFLARVIEQFGITFEFATEDILERGGDVPPHMFRPDGTALHQTIVSNDSTTGDNFQIGQQHEDSLFINSGGGVKPGNCPSLKRSDDFPAHKHATTLTRRHSPNPSRLATSLSPGTTGPTPAGVPVKIRSPACRRINRETSAICSATGHTMSRQSPCCTRLPLRVSDNCPIFCRSA